MIFLLPMALLAIIGWFVRFKKVAWLISGYNTASDEKKQGYDLDKLTKYFGNFLFVLSGIFLTIAAASLLFDEYIDIIIWAGFGALAAAIVVGIVYLNTGGRVKKAQR